MSFRPLSTPCIAAANNARCDNNADYADNGDVYFHYVTFLIFLFIAMIRDGVKYILSPSARRLIPRITLTLEKSEMGGTQPATTWPKI